MKTLQTRLIKIADIDTTDTKTRDNLRDEAVAEYAELIEDGVKMAPPTVFEEGDQLYLAAGFHRLAAYKKLGRSEVECVVKTGTKWDAIRFGIQDNLKHRGERLTNADKQHNIRLVLRNRPAMSDRTVARLCGVTNKTVARRREELTSTGEIPQLDSRVGRDGRVRRQERKPESESERPAMAEKDTCALDADSGSLGNDSEEPGQKEPEEDEDQEAPQGSSGTSDSVPREEKTAADYFAEATRQLDVVTKTVERLAELKPGQEADSTLEHLEKASKAITTWQKR